MTKLRMMGMVAVATLMWTAAAVAMAPAQKCERAKLEAAGQYSLCRFAADARAVRRNRHATYDACDARLADQWSAAERKAGGTCPTNDDLLDAGGLMADQTADIATGIAGLRVNPCRELPATGQTVSYFPADDGDLEKGSTLQYVDNGDGTITDQVTMLTWEKKAAADGDPDAKNPHDADNKYPWSGHCTGDIEKPCLSDAECTGGNTCDVADGQGGTQNTTDFITALNVANFGGHNDWRMPNIRELTTIVNFGTHNPAVSKAFMGSGCGACSDLTDPTCSCTFSSLYWSSTSEDDGPNGKWLIDYSDGDDYVARSSYPEYVRAVRGGL